MNRPAIVYVFFLSYLVLFQTAQAACRYDTVKATTPKSQFILYDDGTATDTTTNLMWARCTQQYTWDGSTCIENADLDQLEWEDALLETIPPTSSSYTNWRLPNIRELASIVERACEEPAINSIVFPNHPATSGFLAYVWSSTPQRSTNGDMSMAVAFGDGTVASFFRSDPNSVRLVRDVLDGE